MKRFTDQDLVEIGGNPYGCRYSDMAEMAEELLAARMVIESARRLTNEVRDPDTEDAIHAYDKVAS